LGGNWIDQRKNVFNSFTKHGHQTGGAQECEEATEGYMTIKMDSLEKTKMTGKKNPNQELKTNDSYHLIREGGGKKLDPNRVPELKSMVMYTVGGKGEKRLVQNKWFMRISGGKNGARKRGQN